MNLNFLKKALPWIGAAAGAAATGNPLGLLTFAAKQIGGITGGEVKPTADSIAAAVAGATPDQLTAMKKIDNDFAVTMQQLGYQDEQEMAKILTGDVADARQMQIKTQSKAPALLAAFTTAGFFGVLALMVFHSIPSDTHDALMLMLGSLGTAWTSVVAYYFGSSAGSAAKTQLLANGNGSK